MQAHIQLDSKEIDKLRFLLGSTDKRAQDYKKVLIVIEPNDAGATFVAGNALMMNSLTVINIEIDKNYSGKSFFSAYEADILLEVIKRSPQSLLIQLIHDGGLDDSEMVFPKLPNLRHAYGEEVEQVHLDYFNARSAEEFTQYKKDSLLGFIQHADKECKPFEYIVVESNESVGDRVKVQRDGEVFYQELSTRSQLNLNVCLDKHSISTLESICASSNEESIGMRVDLGSISFQTGGCISKIKIPDHADFLSKTTRKKEVIISFLLDAYKLKDELESYTKLNSIKKQDKSYLFITNRRLVVCAESEKLKCADILELIDMSTVNNELLLMVNLHDFKDLKIKDVTEFNKMKASITRSEIGDYQFSFFHSSDPDHAFFSVACVSVPNHIEIVEPIYQELEAQRASQDEKAVKKENEQMDMLGYGELLDV